MDTKVRLHIIHLLQGHTGINRICRLVDVSKYQVYKIIDETGLRKKRTYKSTPKSKTSVAVVEKMPTSFVCPGIGYCGGCNHAYQYPCKLGYYS